MFKSGILKFAISKKKPLNHECKVHEIVNPPYTIGAAQLNHAYYFFFDLAATQS